MWYFCDSWHHTLTNILTSSFLNCVFNVKYGLHKLILPTKTFSRQASRSMFMPHFISSFHWQRDNTVALTNRALTGLGLIVCSSVDTFQHFSTFVCRRSLVIGCWFSRESWEELLTKLLRETKLWKKERRSGGLFLKWSETVKAEASGDSLDEWSRTNPGPAENKSLGPASKTTKPGEEPLCNRVSHP